VAFCGEGAGAGLAAGTGIGAGIAVATEDLDCASQFNASVFDRCGVLAQPANAKTAKTAKVRRAATSAPFIKALVPKHAHSRQQNSLKPDFPQWNTLLLCGTIPLTQAVSPKTGLFLEIREIRVRLSVAEWFVTSAARESKFSVQPSSFPAPILDSPP
jgi:hypothetical protein